VPAVACVEQTVRAWVSSFVVELDLCPFAKPTLREGNLRIAVCSSAEQQEIVRYFLAELDHLQNTPESELVTTLLVYPEALACFDEYLGFIDDAQQLTIDAGLEGIVQLASFHPKYQFAGEPFHGASHFSNRAPYPIVHLLREDTLERVLADYPNPEEIPVRNIRTLEALGVDALTARWQALFGVK
jgi:hypothetical protein